MLEGVGIQILLASATMPRSLDEKLNSIVPVSLIHFDIFLLTYIVMLVLSQEVSSTIFEVFGMTRTGIEPKSPKPLANTLPTRTKLYEI